MEPESIPPVRVAADLGSPEVGRRAGLSGTEKVAMPVVAGLVLAASYLRWWSISVTEAWGFATGGICVWLTVREHLWNWPIGLANNVVFFALFYRSRLFADMSLQVVYFALGAYGWWQWVYGGQNRGPLAISRTSRREGWAVVGVTLLATWGLHALLLAVNGSAPFWDSVTTALSLAAQYLLCRKRLENWWVWIVADLIYVPLYFSRGLALTGLLYGVFLVMCVIGLREWQRNWRAEGSAR